MKFIKPNKILLITALLTVPLALAYLSDSFFKNSSKEVLSQMAETSGTVAGISNILIMPNAEIISVDTSNEYTSVTLESDKTEQEIKEFYKDYSPENIKISGNIIQITIKN